MCKFAQLKLKKMKKYIIGAIFVIAVVFVWEKFFSDKPSSEDDKTTFTNIIIRNSSSEPKVKVYLTIQSPNSVVGMFGIKASDTINSCSKGFFYAIKGHSYSSNKKTALNGVVLSFDGDNIPCQVAVPLGYKTGINIFECSVNVSSEVFDISCEDGVNSILKVRVSDSVNWATGESTYIKNFRSAQNTFPLMNNLGIRGVFPYRCTNCRNMVAPIPENCFNLKDTCNTEKICQVARTNHIGGTILVDYISSAK